MLALLPEKPTQVVVTRIDPGSCENAEITSLEGDLRVLNVFCGPGVGRSLTGSLVGAYNPHVRTVCVYHVGVSKWNSQYSALVLDALTLGSTSVENNLLIEAFGALQRELRRFSKFELNWDSAGAHPFSFETISSAKEILSQAFEAARKSEEGKSTAPLLSPCDERICFTWKSNDKELWVYTEDKLADVYRWHPLGNRESDSFEQVPISKVREHIDWVLS